MNILLLLSIPLSFLVCARLSRSYSPRFLVPLPYILLYSALLSGLGIFIPNQSQLHTPENKSCVKETYAVTIEVETLLTQDTLLSCFDHVRCNETYYLT